VSAVLVLGSFFLLRQKNSPTPDSHHASSGAVADAGIPETRALDWRAGIPERTNPPIEVKVENSISSDEDSPIAKHKAYVESRVNELMELAMNDDSSSLDTILSELTNRDPEIRKAALQATIQFGSRDAIPKMLDAASQTDDPREKAEIAEAVEFLKLPSLTETLAQARSAPGPKTSAAKTRTANRPAPNTVGP
jgi:hypothetical protein